MSRTSTPSTSTRPQLASWKRIASEATVDLPEPMAPMMATVSPVRTVKLT